MTAPDLAGFLLGVYDQIEATARKAAEGRWEADGTEIFVASLGPREGWLGETCALNDDDEANAAHIALHDPAFVLADIAAKRAVVKRHRPFAKSCRTCIPDGVMHGPCVTLLALAQPYRGRPGWRDEWGTG